MPLPALDAGSLIGYNTTVNALRVGKGFLFAFALIPFLQLAVRRDGDAALDRSPLGPPASGTNRSGWRPPGPSRSSEASRDGRGEEIA